MTNKAYIVVNEQQEREVLEKLEREGFKWKDGDKLTEFLPSKGHVWLFPYVIFAGNKITFDTLSELEDEEIVFDGRKEDNMSEKFVVSQEFMNELKEWKDTLTSNDDEYKPLVSWVNIKNLPETVYMWLGDDVPDKENNNRLIAIIRWVNGEDVFEVEKPKKWVVQSKERDEYGNYGYVLLENMVLAFNRYNITQASRFDTKEEAQEWANSHQEVVEVVDV